MSAIEVRHLTKRFGPNTAVDDLSFTVPYGAVTGLVGGNGSGKSTTMLMTLGVIRPTSGDALVAGRPITDHTEAREVVGAVLDRVGAHPGHTARRHLRLLATSAGLDRERGDDLLDQVGLTQAADRRVAGYSTGMRQRLALAAALLGDPPILVLDEPSSGLDPAGIRWMRDLLRSRADAGHAIVLATHQLAELQRIVDHLVVIHEGHLTTAGPTEQVLADADTTSIEDVVIGETATP